MVSHKGSFPCCFSQKAKDRPEGKTGRSFVFSVKEQRKAACLGGQDAGQGAKSGNLSKAAGKGLFF